MCVVGEDLGQAGVKVVSRSFTFALTIRCLMGTESVLGWGGVCPYRLQSARLVHVTFQSVVLGTLGRRPTDFPDVSSHSHL